MLGCLKAKLQPDECELRPAQFSKAESRQPPQPLKWRRCAERPDDAEASARKGAVKFSSALNRSERGETRICHRMQGENRCPTLMVLSFRCPTPTVKLTRNSPRK